MQFFWMNILDIIKLLSVKLCVLSVSTFVYYLKRVAGIVKKSMNFVSFLDYLAMSKKQQRTKL